MRMKNPFLIPKFFGQNQADSRLQPGGRFELASNVAFVAAYLTCFGVAMFTMKDKFGDKLYGFISKMKFSAQFYEMGFLACLMSLTTTNNRNVIVTTYHSLVSQHLDLKKMQIEHKFNFLEIYVLYFCVFASAAAVLAVDIVNTGSKYSVFFWVALYLPGLCCWVYVIQTSSFYKGCTIIFETINAYLDELSQVEKSLIGKLALNNMNLKPDGLFKKVPDEENTIYEKIFIIHDKTCEIARFINITTGYEYFMFIAISTTAALSFVFDQCMDLMISSRGGTPLVRSYFACDYWAFLHTLGIFYIVHSSSNLMEASNSTKYYLHKLRNIYPEMEEHFELFSLQLIHQHLELTAAKCFGLDRSILYKLLLAFATYIIILVDLDTEDDAY